MVSIIEFCLFLDKKILEIINITLSNNLFDNVMPIIDKREGFILPVLFFWIFSIFKNPTKRKKLIILIPLVIALTDQIGYRVKKLEIRERPWVRNVHINHLGGHGGKNFSFPSNHAANSMAIAMLFYNILGKKYWILFFLALVSGYSRIYIGVHYPGDVLAGFLLGIMIAKMLIMLTLKFEINLVKYRQVD